ncbi:Xaa-Pro peptidase family protein [Paenibacillus sp. KQZ6P-2]|uniref:Xaa-Pro peptidase family protein n=2 Tax=Paenibacillus mangrovi TaxID=2931978 RepID=A0A9X2B3B2_9BACL|nr:Xaa-Pro peptidase family protein [Paenibacillus mangrovi]
METLELDGMLIESPSNRRYITGFTGTAGTVLISRNQAKLITDFRYVEQAGAQAIGFEIVRVSKASMIQQIADEVSKMNMNKLGFEKEHLTFGTYQKLQNAIAAELVPVAGVIENLRMVKSETEIGFLRTAAQIADTSFAEILEHIRPGLTEKEIANTLESTLRKHGADSSSFNLIVVSGHRSALPHGLASEKIIENGDMLTFDFGAYYKGYRSDITRTIAIGKPDKQLQDIYQIVLEAEMKCIALLKPGALCSEIDTFTHNYIESLGYGEYFGHGTGHGIGLDIHEEPFFSTTSEKVLAPGMIVTVEPGIYIPNLGGVRIEDDVLITDTGYEIITNASRELIVL